MNLSQLIILPLIASALILICRNAEQVKRVALAAAAGQLLLTARLLFAFTTPAMPVIPRKCCFNTTLCGLPRLIFNTMWGLMAFRWL
jgi:hypothetical protein